VKRDAQIRTEPRRESVLYPTPPSRFTFHVSDPRFSSTFHSPPGHLNAPTPNCPKFRDFPAQNGTSQSFNRRKDNSLNDYYQQGKRSWIRLHEKGGKFHEVPAHHNAEEYLDAYITAAGIMNGGKRALFRSAAGTISMLSDRQMSRTDVLRMVKRRALATGIGIDRICCHTFRATGITAYLENGGTIENAQAIAAHESPRTTKLYDRTADTLTLDEIERIAI
jgi:hypothetical protein